MYKLYSNTNTIMRNLFPLTILFYLLLFTQVNGQSHLKKGWEINTTGGIDFSGLLKVNPAAGSGDSQLAFGGSLSAMANFNSSKTSWNNSMSINYGVQKSGFYSSSNPDIKNPFQKSIDQLRINSRLGYRSSILYPGARFLYTIDFSFASQMTNTFVGNFASKPAPELDLGNSIISKFFSPATVYISPGIDYRPIDQLSFYYSPGAFKYLIVLDDDIASSVIFDDRNMPVAMHGNPIRTDEKGFVNGYKNVDSQIGSLLKITYNDAFFQKRVNINTIASFYSNYLNRPEQIDIDWTCDIGINIIEGLQISLWSNLFYDYDIPVQKTNNLRLIEGSYTRGVSFTQQLLLKYSLTF